MGLTFDEVLDAVKDNSSLEHHGILGQRKGHRNGPPYPLRNEDRSAAEKKLNKESDSSKELSPRPKKEKKKKKQKSPIDEIPDYKKLSPEEVEEKKKQAIRDGNVKEVSKNRSNFTDQEINAVINRYDLNDKLTKYSKKDIKTAMDKLNSAMAKMDTIKNAGEKTFAMYETVAKIMNTVAGTNLPTQASRNAERNKNNENKNGNNKDSGRLEDLSWDHEYTKYIDGKKQRRLVVKDGKIQERFYTDQAKQEARAKNKSESKKKGGHK